MSLQVWLPFTNSLYQNNGLLNCKITPVANPNLGNDGKLGKCLNRVGDGNGLSIDTNFVTELDSEYSMAIWVKPLGNHLHYNGTFISSGDWNKSCWSFGVSQDNSKVDVAGPGYNKYIDCPVPVNQWIHLCCVIKNGVSKLYKNGNYVGQYSLSNGGKLHSNYSNTCIQKDTYTGNYFSFNGKINDLRIYDHALSLSEIKDISRGLVAHYPLKDPYIEPTTNLATTQNYDIRNKSTWGGHTYWSERLSSIGTPCPSSQIDHFILEYNGSGGGGGSVYNKQYTIKPSTTYCYSLYVKASDDMEYIHGNFLYRYEYKDGTYVTESGIATRSKRIPLGNGWYRIWNTFTSNASSNKVTLCFYTYPCKNVEYWLACPQLEEKDHLTPYVLGSRNELNIYDVSGNSYNGLLSKNTALVKKDSPRYDKSTFLAGFSNPYIDFSLVVDNSALSNCTITYWARHKSSTTLLFTGQDTGHYVMASANNTWYHANCGSPVVYRNGVKGSYKAEANTWYFYVVKNVNLSAWTKLYLNKYSSSWPFNSDISDLRIYATALSDEDILKLYQSPTKISKNGVLITNGEFIEC